MGNAQKKGCCFSGNPSLKSSWHYMEFSTLWPQLIVLFLSFFPQLTITSESECVVSDQIQDGWHLLSGRAAHFGMLLIGFMASRVLLCIQLHPLHQSVVDIDWICMGAMFKCLSVKLPPMTWLQNWWKISRKSPISPRRLLQKDQPKMTSYWDQPITAQQLLSRPMRSSLCYVSGARGHNYRETPQQYGGVSQHRFSK